MKLEVTPSVHGKQSIRLSIGRNCLGVAQLRNKKTEGQMAFR